MQYTVWSNGRTVRGTAREILQDIQRHARSDSEVGRRTVDEYAEVLISDAAYFFPDRQVPWSLRDRDFDTKFDQALQYLDAMPASGLRILSAKGGNGSHVPNGSTTGRKV
jgi:hypothetical protein